MLFKLILMPSQYVKKMLQYIKRNFKDKYLIILLVASLIITVYRIDIQLSRGPGWDTFAFLANAKYFAGQSIGYLEPHRPPMLSFLASFFYRLGMQGEFPLYLTEGIIFNIGLVSLYKLFNIRFKKEYSILGAFIYLSMPFNIHWLSFGYSDLSSISFSIIAIYLCVLSCTKDKKYFMLMWPACLCAVLTRTTAGLIFLPITTYMLLKLKRIDFKEHIIGLIISTIIFTPFGIYNQIFYGNPFRYLFNIFSSLGSMEDTTSIEGLASFSIDRQHYFKMLINDSLAFSHQIYFICFVSLGLVIRFWQSDKGIKKIKNVIYLVLFFLIFIYLLYNFRFIIVGITTFFLILLVANRMKKDTDNHVAITAVFLVWILEYFVFHSQFSIKVGRYMLTMLPGFVFFIVLGYTGLMKKIAFKTKRKKMICSSITFLLIVICMSQAAYSTSSFEKGEYQLIGQSKDMTAWIQNNISDYQNKTFYGDVWPYSSWHLSTNVMAMPFFYGDVAKENELQKYGIGYYISNKPRDFTSYELIHKEGDLILYKKKYDVIKPRLLYIGRNWENYIEYVLNFKYYVVSGEKQIREFSSYIDDYKVEELLKFNAVVLYNFKWKEWNESRDMLLNYVMEGGITGYVIKLCNGRWKINNRLLR